MSLGSSSWPENTVLPNVCPEDREMGQDSSSTGQDSWGRSLCFNARA